MRKTYDEQENIKNPYGVIKKKMKEHVKRQARLLREYIIRISNASILIPIYIIGIGGTWAISRIARKRFLKGPEWVSSRTNDHHRQF